MAIAEVKDVRNSVFINGSPASSGQMFDYGDVIETYDISKGLEESFKSDVIVSLNPESSYILKINKIQYFETYEFCNHKELWLKYKDLLKRSIKIYQGNLLKKKEWRKKN